MLQGQYRLDQTRYARGGFKVTEVGLYRTYHKRSVLWAFLAKYCPQCTNLNRVSQRCAGAMGLYITYL
jgi:hypothetical protein